VKNEDMKKSIIIHGKKYKITHSYKNTEEAIKDMMNNG